MLLDLQLCFMNYDSTFRSYDSGFHVKIDVKIVCRIFAMLWYINSKIELLCNRLTVTYIPQCWLGNSINSHAPVTIFVSSSAVCQKPHVAY